MFSFWESLKVVGQKAKANHTNDKMCMLFICSMHSQCQYRVCFNEKCNAMFSHSTLRPNGSIGMKNGCFSVLKWKYGIWNNINTTSPWQVCLFNVFCFILKHFSLSSTKWVQRKSLPVSKSKFAITLLPFHNSFRLSSEMSSKKTTTTTDHWRQLFEKYCDIAKGATTTTQQLNSNRRNNEIKIIKPANGPKPIDIEHNFIPQSESLLCLLIWAMCINNNNGQMP